MFGARCFESVLLRGQLGRDGGRKGCGEEGLRVVDASIWVGLIGEEGFGLI